MTGCCCCLCVAPFCIPPHPPQHIDSSHHSSSGSAPARLPHHWSPSSSSSASFLLILFLTAALGCSCDQGRGIHFLSLYDLSALMFLFLFTLIVLHWSLLPALLTTLCSSFSALITISAPLFLLCSSPIFLIRSDLPRFFTCLHSLPLQYDLLVPLGSALSDLLAYQPWLLRLFSALLSLIFTARSYWLSLDQLAQLCSVFGSSGRHNLFKKTYHYVTPRPSSTAYYNIEVINNLNIKFIVIATTRTQSQTHNDAGILVPNSDPDSHFCPGCAEQAKNWLWN